MDERIRKKISRALRGRKKSLATRRKMSKARLGVRISSKTRERMSKAHKGMRHSESSKRKISKALRGRKRKGTARAGWSPERRAKMEDAVRLRQYLHREGIKSWHSVEGRKRISEKVRKKAKARAKARPPVPPKPKPAREEPALALLRSMGMDVQDPQARNLQQQRRERRKAYRKALLERKRKLVEAGVLTSVFSPLPESFKLPFEHRKHVDD